MKREYAVGHRLNARMVLEAANASVGQDFHTLTSSQVDVILEEANRTRYQKPKGANGSRARYFYALLQRRAKGYRNA